MGFLDKLRASMARFMSGRYGADQLSMAMVIAALVVALGAALTLPRMARGRSRWCFPTRC